MKKILVMMMLLPIFVSAETCNTVIDKQTTSNRNLVCDANNKTTTSFKTNKEEVVLNNSVCSKIGVRISLTLYKSEIVLKICSSFCHFAVSSLNKSTVPRGAVYAIVFPPLNKKRPYD